MTKSDKVGTLLTLNDDSVVIQEEGTAPIALGDLAKSYLKSNPKALTIGGRATYTLITGKDKAPVITYITMSYAKKAAPGTAPAAAPPAEKPAPKTEPKAEVKPKENTQKPIPAEKPAQDANVQAPAVKSKETAPTAVLPAVAGTVTINARIKMGFNHFEITVSGNSGDEARALVEAEGLKTIAVMNRLIDAASGL